LFHGLTTFKGDGMHMRASRLLVLTVLLSSFLGGCDIGQDLDIQSDVAHSGTDAGVPVAQSPAQQEPVALSTELASTPGKPTSTLPEQTAQPAAPVVSPELPRGITPTPAKGTHASPTQQPEKPPDVYTFDPSAWEQSITVLSSFRQKVVLGFVADGTGAQSKLTYDGETTTHPLAFHFILYVEGKVAAQLPTNRAEVIWIVDRAWIKLGRKPWLQMQAEAIESEYAGQVVTVGDLLPLVPQATRLLPDEMVNGIPCKHYVYDASNLQPDAGMNSARGDIWVAQDGGYVVRLTLNGRGSYYGTYDTNGSLSLVYDLYDVDTPISIEPPR
jgi:hypothetical protein